MPLNPLIVYQFSDTVPEGEVISQDPPYTPGSPVDPDTVVTIYISSGSAAEDGISVSPGSVIITGQGIDLTLSGTPNRVYFTEQVAIAVLRAA